jgi:Nif-specific regulatory protein
MIRVQAMPKLIVSVPGEEGRILDFASGTVSVGRDESNTVRLNDPDLEPRHCQIELAADGRCKLVDLETRAGTSVNGSKVNAHLLEDNDRIDLGRCSILFRAGEEDPGNDRTQQIHAIRPSRRTRKFGRRRVILPPPQQGEKVFTYEDLRLVLASLIEENGPDALDEIRKAFDQAHEEHRGSPLVSSLMEERDGLYRIAQINTLINSEHNLRNLLELIMDTVIELAGAERGFLILKEKDSLAIRVARNFDRESIKKPAFKVSHSVAEGVIRTGRPVLSADALNDPTFSAGATVSDLKLRSLLCMPFRVRDRILGCVYIDNRFKTGVFIEDDLPLLQAFADQAAIAIENARLFEENLLRQEELRRSKEEIERLNAELREKIEKQSAELAQVTQDLLSSRRDFEPRHDFGRIIGKSRALKEVFTVLDKVIDTDEPVFVHGESGTGKELVARAIHANSPRAKSGRFVSENCSAIPDTLMESGLFGHEKGAFTGAVASRPGLFEQAHQGTLFLDEIGDMSLDMQKKLLRAIQEGEIRRVGGQDVIRVDVRIISASNKDLAELIKAGKFREDLFYRLNVVKITLPPLRARREDIPLLADHFLRQIALEQNQPARAIDEAAMSYLQAYPWPGNVRELENEIRRAVALSEGTITFDVLKEEIRSKDALKPPVKIAPGAALKDIVREAVEDLERRVILKALESCGWKKTEAARALGISRPTLDAKIDAYNLTRTHPVTD